MALSIGDFRIQSGQCFHATLGEIPIEDVGEFPQAWLYRPTKYAIIAGVSERPFWRHL
jgi:hypothetical protein